VYWAEMMVTDETVDKCVGILAQWLDNLVGYTRELAYSIDNTN